METRAGKMMLGNFLLNPDAFIEEDMVLVFSSTIANHCERQVVSMSEWPWRSAPDGMVDQKRVSFLLTQQKWSAPKRWMHDCGQHQFPSHSRSDAYTTGCLDGLLAFGCNVEWGGTRETCTSPVRMRQFMTRERKRRHPRLFELNS